MFGNAIRDSMPVEEILRAYLDETMTKMLIENIKEEKVEVPIEEHKFEDIDKHINKLCMEGKCGMWWK